MTDGMLLAEIAAGPAAAAVRHDHRRRGARAQPQHRLPARLPAPAAAAATRPEGRHHVGDDRPGAVLPRTSAARRWSRCPAASTRSRSATDPWPSRRRRTTRTTRPRHRATRSRGSATRSRSSPREGPGDILVFLSGEREIRDAADALRGLELRQTEVLPLYARLSAAEQHRVFRPHTGRRVVLATNVAETSLTVPGIRYVVDPGTARISRYSHATEGAAAADRADLAGLRATSARAAADGSTDGSLHPALRRGRPRRAAGVHRPRDPAHDPGLGDPADGSLRARRRGGLPLPRPAGPRARSRDGVQLLDELGALDPRRAPTSADRDRTAAGARCRSTRASAGWCSRPERAGLPARGARHRGGAVDPGPARAADRRAGGRRRAAPPLRRPALGLPRLPEPVGAPRGAAARAVWQRVPPDVPVASSSTTCGSASGRTCSRSCGRSAEDVGVTRNGAPARPR